MIEKKFNIILELERLRKYHPIFEIEYENCTFRNLPYYLEQQVTFSANIQDESEFEDYYKILIDAYIIEDQHVANMLGIIKAYIEHSEPYYAEELSYLETRLLNIVCNLDKLEKFDAKSAIRFIIKSNLQFSKTNGFEISDQNELEKITNFLKVSYLEELHSLKSSFQALAGENNIEKAEPYIDIAISLVTGIKSESSGLKTFQSLKKELETFIPKRNFNKGKYKNDFLRMIYKTLLEYLNNETSIKPQGIIDGVPKKTTVEQFRIIYQLCYCFGLVERIEDKTKQYEKVKNILKDFKEDNRPKLLRLTGP